MPERNFFGRDPAPHQAFRNQEGRALFGINPGFLAGERFPRTMSAVPDGPISPDDIRTDLFLEDCDHLYRLHAELEDDYPFVASPLVYVPWMEAIAGCPVIGSRSGFWAEPFISDWRKWEAPSEGPWERKLLELMHALVAQSAGRYPVSATLMRGISDIVAAVRGAALLPMDFIDLPGTMKEVIDKCVNTWTRIARAQLDLIPPSNHGYMDGDRGFRVWSEDPIVWLQEDALAVLSPAIFREFILPADRRIAEEMPAVAFHLHGSALWAINGLLDTSIDVIELNLDAADVDQDATFQAWKKIQSRKPLVAWWLDGPDSRAVLERVLSELSPAGLSIQITTAGVQEGLALKKMFLERVNDG